MKSGCKPETRSQNTNISEDSFLIIQTGEQTSLLVFVDLFATLDADSDHDRLLKEMARLHSEYIKMI